MTPAASTVRATPLFSVIVPTHDRPELLPVAVASILAQTVGDFEVLIVDDAGSRPVAPFDDPRVRVIRRAQNGGPAAAINTGACEARGRYLAFLDDDDLWLPCRLELALQGLARAPVALCWSRYLDEIPGPKPVLDGDVRDTILDHVTPSKIAAAVDREAFLPLDERYRGSEDVAWWLAMAQRHEVATVPRFGALVRRHAQVRVAHGDDARIDGGLMLLDEERDWFAAHPRARAMRWQRVGLTAARAGALRYARRAYVTSLRARPRVQPVVHLSRSFLSPARKVRPAPGAAPRTLRILQVITDDDRRGAQVFAHDLGEAMRWRGHHVDTVALAPGAGGGLDVETLGASRLSRESIRALRRRLATADVVVAHGSSTLLACAAATAATGVPFVYRQISDSLFWADTAARRGRVRLLLRRAAAVVALAPGSAAVLRDHFGVPAAAVEVIPNGVPAGAFAPADAARRAAARHALGLDPDLPVVLSMSALVPEKGVDIVIEALAQREGAQLLVAGDGPERRALERVACSLGGRAVFSGSLVHAAPAYAAADVVVLASRGGDSMPATLVEAGFCGLPSVATDVGAIADVVVDGVTGIVVAKADVGAVGDALDRVLTDPYQAAQWGSAARRHCLAHFEIGVVADAWLRVLTGVARER